MQTTMNYDVIVNGEVVDHENKKQDALKIAKRARARDRAHVQVVTKRGTVVFEQAAPKHIKQSPKYTRVVPLPAGVKPPDGTKRVAYIRPRRNGAILHDAVTGRYRIMKLDTGELLEQEFDTAGEAGDRLKSGV